MTKKDKLYKKRLKRYLKTRKNIFSKNFSGRGRHKKIKNYILEQYKEAIEWDNFIDNTKAV